MRTLHLLGAALVAASFGCSDPAGAGGDRRGFGGGGGVQGGGTAEGGQEAGGELGGDEQGGDPGGGPSDECVSDSDCEGTESCVVGADSMLACVERPCDDEDGDRYGEGDTCLGPDCDDNAANVHPAAPEVCDEIDNDCDDTVDEGFDTQVDSKNCGACGQRCSADTQLVECVAGQCRSLGCLEGMHDADGDPANGCEYDCFQTNDGVEACNGRDNDCDGAIDQGEDGEPLDRDCYPGPDDTRGIGICAGGQQVCNEGAYSQCEGAVVPEDEVCNGLDDDCNGLTDDDEDGLISAACYTGPDGSEDVGLCHGGTSTCSGGELADCDGESLPRPELCDELDNDCDGQTDEDFVLGDGCVVGLGECARPGVGGCDGRGGFTCVGMPGEPTDELCDGLDNDCDGFVDRTGDDPLTRECYDGPEDTGSVGECALGFELCANGIYLPCADAVHPVDDECNQLDDDCDGDTDEGLECGVACDRDPLWEPVRCETAEWVWSSNRNLGRTVEAAEAAKVLYTGCGHAAQVPGMSEGFCSLTGEGWVSTESWAMAGCNASWFHLGGRHTGNCGGHDGDTTRLLVMDPEGCWDYQEEGRP